MTVRRVWCHLVMLVLAALGAATAVVAQPAPPGVNAVLDSARAKRGEQLQITLVTYGPTDVVWERFGHDAIAVHDTVTGEDVAYNWGMFAFDDPGFYTRFLTGETNYWMVVVPTAPSSQYYIARNSTIRVQRLALTPVERAALSEFLAWNALDANKYYRYDYYNDNCSTRARDALDRVLKGRLKIALDSGRTGLTWRSETARVTASNLPVYAGIEMALGRHADADLTPWRASFMPERLAEAVGPLVLRNDAGLRYRLVAHDSIVFASTRVPMPIDPPDRLAMAALLGLTVAGLVAFLADSRSRALRVVLVAFAAVWYTVGGVLGTALLLAGTVTKHAPYMGANITLWQLNPMLLVAAVLAPLALLRGRASLPARTTTLLVAALAAVGALLQLVPALAQESGVVIAVTLPVHVALAIALWRMRATGDARAARAAALARAA